MNLYTLTPFLWVIIVLNLYAMESNKPLDMKLDKEALYAQFCVAQWIKEKFLEQANSWLWSDRILQKECNTFEPGNEISREGILLRQTTIQLAIGKWCFAQVWGMHCLDSAEDIRSQNDTWSRFWREFFGKVGAKYYRSGATMRAPVPSITAYTYKISESGDNPIASITETLVIEPSQAQKLWLEMQERYAATTSHEQKVSSKI